MTHVLQLRLAWPPIFFFFVVFFFFKPGRSRLAEAPKHLSWAIGSTAAVWESPGAKSPPRRVRGGAPRSVGSDKHRAGVRGPRVTAFFWQLVRKCALSKEWRGCLLPASKQEATKTDVDFALQAGQSSLFKGTQGILSKNLMQPKLVSLPPLQRPEFTERGILFSATVLMDCVSKRGEQNDWCKVVLIRHVSDRENTNCPSCKTWKSKVAHVGLLVCANYQNVVFFPALHVSKFQSWPVLSIVWRYPAGLVLFADRVAASVSTSVCESQCKCGKAGTAAAS